MWGYVLVLVYIKCIAQCARVYLYGGGVTNEPSNHPERAAAAVDRRAGMKGSHIVTRSFAIPPNLHSFIAGVECNYVGAGTSTGTEIADRIIWDSFISKWHVWDLVRVVIAGLKNNCLVGGRKGKERWGLFLLFKV